MTRERHGGKKLEMLSSVLATVNLRFLQDCDWKGYAQGGSSGSQGPQKYTLGRRRRARLLLLLESLYPQEAAIPGNARLDKSNTSTSVLNTRNEK